MGFAPQECVGSFIDVSVVVLEDPSSEIPIDVTHHRRERVNLFVEWIDSIAAGRRRHSGLGAGVVVVVVTVVIFLVCSGSVWWRVWVTRWEGDVCSCLARTPSTSSRPLDP